jgi:benzoyl-CoA reductase subunit C
MSAILEKLKQVATDPYRYVRDDKQASGIKVVGSFPMHFPAEIAHAAGALPVILQELEAPITTGGGAMYPFFCGYTRSIVDQTTQNELGFLDAIMFADHCVQLLSAADIMRVVRPETKVHFHQMIASLRQEWSLDNSVKTLRALIEDMEEVLGVSITEDALRNSICVFNENRRLIRNLYQLRRTGAVNLRASQMQHIVKSSMVMRKDEHNALLRELTASLDHGAPAKSKVPLYVSGHLCQAPRPEILDLIEDCGINIIDDDLYHGYRYVSTDVEEGIGDPVVAIAKAYIRKNEVVPCPTRIDPNVDWNEWLFKAVGDCGAQGLVVLMAKFCEPHYFHYPRIKATFEAANVPHLLIETEHEGVPMENVRTKVESFAEMIKSQHRVTRVNT